MLSRRHWLAATPSLAAAAPAIPDRRAVIQERARALASFPGQRIPAAANSSLDRARKIASGVVYFYSRNPVEVGLRDIDWSGKHVRHQEWPAQLNRFFHLAPLASAYSATRDETFARAARSYIEDWLREDPYPAARTFRPGDNALTMSIRLGTSVQPGWSGCLPAFLPSPAFDDAFLERIFDSLSRQAAYLSGRLTAVGNWRISQLDALVFLSLRLPFLPDAPRLLQTGIDGMRNALATQFLPDGVHIERTPGYHDWMAQVAVNYSRLAHRFPEADAHVNAARTVRALDYGAQSELFGVNDSMAPHRDPASLARLAMRRESLAAMKLDARYPGEPPLDQVFPDAGQVFSRSAWKPGADYLAFDASTWGGGHGHLSRLSFAFRSGGRMLVADPGILTYEMSDPTGPYGKSTAAHSTLNLEGGNQSGADAHLLHTAFTPRIALIHARYQGAYWPGRFTWSFSGGRGAGMYGEHERVLLWVKGEYLLVLDSMTTDKGREIRNCWQLGPMEKWSLDEASHRWWSLNPDVNLALWLAIAPPGAVMQCASGEREPLRGWVGHHGHDAVPAPSVEFRYAAPDTRPVLSAVLLAPYRGEAPPAYGVKVVGGRSAIQHLEIALPGGAVDHVAWGQGLALPIDDGAPFTTDATFLWTRSGDPAKRFLLNGTYLRG